MNKFDRITAILIHLQSKRLVTAQELSERFHVSQRTIYRDIETLNNAGVPIIGELGVGYSMMDGYRLPPIMFSQQEAISFLIAEKILNKYGDAENRKHFESALYKIKSVLRHSDKIVAEDIEERISIIKNIEPNILLDNNLPLIIKSLTDKEIIQMEYLMLSQSDQKTCTLEPIGIINENGNWVTIAYHKENKEYRKFRIDRIINLKLINKPFTKKHVTVNEFLKLKKPNEIVYHPVIKIKKDIAHYIEEQKHLYGFVNEYEEKGYMKMTFKTTCLQTFSRWFLTIADNAKIIEPKELQTMIKEIVINIEKNLSLKNSN